MNTDEPRRNALVVGLINQPILFQGRGVAPHILMNRLNLVPSEGAFITKSAVVASMPSLPTLVAVETLNADVGLASEADSNPLLASRTSDAGRLQSPPSARRCAAGCIVVTGGTS